MAEPAKVVAVLVANSALSSILSMVLAAVPSLRVRPFDSQLALTTYMQLAPVDLVVTDFDSDQAPADQVARALRAETRLERRDFQIIALASTVTRDMKYASISAGIDEIIVKPMSPKYLLERVLARLQRRAAVLADVPRRRQPPSVAYRDPKVVPLFGPRFEPQH